ncbi:MAG: hypothetical protein ACOYOU_11950 [Kiritimatiellia bacterium]
MQKSFFHSGADSASAGVGWQVKGAGNQPAARLRREQTIGQLEILRDLRVSAVETELGFTIHFGLPSFPRRQVRQGKG